ncbi:MAG: hypothetical protein EXR00_01605 [Alphaproteobacteria bacterium]|nr:hypothetical protein [Alphaproteobacteria bacterium]
MFMPDVCSPVLKHVLAAIRTGSSPTKGNIWAGRGLAPKWLKAAEKAGQKRDTFLV